MGGRGGGSGAGRAVRFLGGGSGGKVLDTPLVTDARNGVGGVSGGVVETGRVSQGADVPVLEAQPHTQEILFEPPPSQSHTHTLFICIYIYMHSHAKVASKYIVSSKSVQNSKSFFVTQQNPLK